MKIGYCCGVFDLGHIGHINFLHNAKKLCDKLYIGVVLDSAIKKQKGQDRPILTYEERVAWLMALGYKSNNIRLQVTFDPSMNLERIRPDIFIKGEDQTHISEKNAVELNIPISYLKRTEGISTSDIIKRIQK